MQVCNTEAEYYDKCKLDKITTRKTIQNKSTTLNVMLDKRTTVKVIMYKSITLNVMLKRSNILIVEMQLT